MTWHGGVLLQVLAVDFLPHLIEANKATNAARTNITFRSCDVNVLEMEPSSVQLAFSNWLLMYLSDEEVTAFAAKVLGWVSPFGFTQFRESCFHASGNAARPSENPTHYRKPSEYDAIFSAARFVDADGVAWRWTLKERANVHAYEVIKHNPNQIRWVWQKVRVDEGTPAPTPSSEELDTTQYTEVGILRYERIFGAGFVSTGGKVTTTEFLSRLNLKPGMRVLDVGCGIGGGDFLMAELYGVEVVGIDLSTNMVNIAKQRAAAKPGLSVTFEVRDATTTEFEPESFDVVYSRDTLLHIHGKPELFRRFLGWLKPGGQLFISDYSRDFPEVTPENHDLSETFEAYVAQRGYHLMTPAAYGDVVKGAGFATAKATDETDLFESSLRRELETTRGSRDAFVSEFTEEDYDYIMQGWEKKLTFVAGGFQKWAIVHAFKAE